MGQKARGRRCGATIRACNLESCARTASRDSSDQRTAFLGCMFLANPQESLHGKIPRSLRIIDSDSGLSSNPTLRPYPVQYVSAWTTTGGMAVVIRPIRPEDEPLMVKFHGTLSEQSVYLRYFHMEKLDSRVAHERLVKKCFINYESEMALVADWQNPSTGEHQILAVGRMTKIPDVCEAEVAVLVSDQAQKQGLGTELVRRLIEVARDEKLERLVAVILPENCGMMALARHFRFTVRESADPTVIVAVLGL
jgi:acetyltransferase